MGAFSRSGNVTADGDRSIAIGGDAINSLLVTGDGNTFFIGRYERLVDAYLSPSALNRELEMFTGRQWLLARVDAFVTEHDRGYLIVEADAGMGKSTFLAWLARERGYAHHFVRLMPDPQDIAVAVRNLSSQLITAWDLETHAVGGMLPPSAGRPDFLQDLLVDVAARRDEIRPGEPIVLVVDGLNETIPAGGNNPLGLPMSLPEGVYVIASQRPVQVPLRVDVPRAVVVIEASSEGNMGDAREYLARVSRFPDVAAKLDEAEISADAFIDTLVAKSSGVWIYLHYVLAEIRRGRRSPADVAQLPTGLWHYYAQYWHEWQHNHPERWAEFHLPALAVLAAEGEPLPSRMLAEFTGAPVGAIETLLEDDWRPFVQVEETEEGNLYRTFHDSLREFVHGDVDTRELTSAERSLAGRLARAARSAHSQLADRYLDAWGGLVAGLPGLREESMAGMDHGYGLRHLIEHLHRAGRNEDLHEVLARSWTDGRRRVNVWFTVHRRTGQLAAFRRDIGMAWNVLRTISGPLCAARQLRYALILSSLNSMAAATPPLLWPTLVKNDSLGAEEALAWARQVPAPEERAETLTRLIEVVPGCLREEVEREALAAVRAVPDGYWRLGELWRLHSLVSAELRGDLLAIVRSLADGYYQAVAYRMLNVEGGADTTSFRQGSRSSRTSARHSGWAGAAGFVEEYLRRRHFAVTLLREGEIGAGEAQYRASGDPAERYWRTHMLALDLAQATDEDRGRLAVAAMDMGQNVGDARSVVSAWAAFAGLLKQSEEVVGTIFDPAQRAAFVIATAPLGNAELIINALGSVSGDEVRAEVVVAAGRAMAALGPQVLNVVAMIEDATMRVRALLAIAALAAPPAAEHMGAALLAMLTGDSAIPGRAALLSRTAAYLPASALGDLWVAIEQFEDTEVRLSLFAAAGIRACTLGEMERASQALELTGVLRAPALARSIAHHHARVGNLMEARRLALALPYVTWRGEILALTAHRLEEAVSDVVIEEAAALADVVDDTSKPPVLARIACEAPARHRRRLTAMAMAAAVRIEEPHERSVAMVPVVEAFLAMGDLAEALRVCAGIPTERLRAEALSSVLAGADAADVVWQAVGQIEALVGTEVRARALLDALVALHAVHGQTQGGSEPLERLFGLVLAEFARRPRRELLDALESLLPLLRQLDGEAGVRVVAEDLSKTVDWWP
ncbi:hypothetical protein [Streptomyces sp. NPDC001070]